MLEARPEARLSCWPGEARPNPAPHRSRPSQAGLFESGPKRPPEAASRGSAAVLKLLTIAKPPPKLSGRLRAMFAIRSRLPWRYSWPHDPLLLVTVGPSGAASGSPDRELREVQAAGGGGCGTAAGALRAGLRGDEARKAAGLREMARSRAMEALSVTDDCQTNTTGRDAAGDA